MPRSIIFTLTAACCLLTLSFQPNFSPEGTSPSIASGVHLAIFAHASPIQPGQRTHPVVNRFGPQQQQQKQQQQHEQKKKTKANNESSHHKRHIKHNNAYDAILHSDSQLPVFWNNQLHHTKKSVKDHHAKRKVQNEKQQSVTLASSSSSSSSSPLGKVGPIAPPAQQKLKGDKDATVKAMLSKILDQPPTVAKASGHPPSNNMPLTTATTVKEVASSDPIQKVVVESVREQQQQQQHEEQQPHAQPQQHQQKQQQQIPPTEVIASSMAESKPAETLLQTPAKINEDTTHVILTTPVDHGAQSSSDPKSSTEKSDGSSTSRAFETASEALCNDFEHDNFLKRALHQLTHDAFHHAVPQSDSEMTLSSPKVVVKKGIHSEPAALSSTSENDSALPEGSSNNKMDIHPRSEPLIEYMEQLHQMEQDSGTQDKAAADQTEEKETSHDLLYSPEEDLEEEGILESFVGGGVLASPKAEHERESVFSPVFENNHINNNNHINIDNNWHDARGKAGGYLQRCIRWFDRQGAVVLTTLLTAAVHLDPSTWSGPQWAVALTLVSVVSIALLALSISYKMHCRRVRGRHGQDMAAYHHPPLSAQRHRHRDESTTLSPSPLGFFHYITFGLFDWRRIRHRHSLAAISPFSKDASTYFALPTYHLDTKVAKTHSQKVANDATASTVSGVNIHGSGMNSGHDHGTNGHSEIRRTSVAQHHQMAIHQAAAQAAAQAAESTFSQALPMKNNSSSRAFTY
ncbi:hypothetical protein BGZ94_003126 [Podila epigama]|nr:hypothetical protein BGZ94_003126 [Podila epigama]